jgi:hypothetical protein
VSTATELLRQGRKSQMWNKYCGFLDLDMTGFMRVQERLLMEEIDLISKHEIGKHFFGDRPPTSIAEFRRRVPVTTYKDFAPFLIGKQDQYPDAYEWAHTSGRSGEYKWVPYTRYSYERMGERILAGVILGAAKERGDVRLEEGDTLVYNTPPRPFVSGISLRAVAEQFNFHFIPDLDKTESMGFQERIVQSFNVGMRDGIDVLGSMGSILVKMGESFAAGARSVKITKSMLHPKVMSRLIKGFITSKIQRRPMLPRDLWKVKVIPAGGTDTAIYREKIAYYWGVYPLDQYGSTEEATLAVQAWNRKYSTFYPHAAFFEFIPEEEWTKWRLDPTYVPQTVLFDEVQTKKRYEVVITNFYGKPLMRYRTHDMVMFPEMEDKEVGIHLPQMSFVGRVADFIDLAGFTGLIDERMVWQAIINSEIPYQEWSIRKEVKDGEPYIRLYIELLGDLDSTKVRDAIHLRLKELNPFYSDYETMMERMPLEVTLLAKGSFQGYMAEKHASGADLAQLKPPHMNPSDEIIRLLMKHSDLKREAGTGGSTNS